MKHLIPCALVALSLASCSTLDDPGARALAHDLRVEVEQQFRDVADATDDAELAAKIDKVAGLADVAAVAWDAYLDGAATESDFLRAVNAALDAAYALVPYVFEGDSQRALLIKASLGSLKVLTMHLAREAGDMATVEKAAALP